MNFKKVTSLILSFAMLFCFASFITASPPTAKTEKITKTNFEKSDSGKTVQVTEFAFASENSANVVNQRTQISDTSGAEIQTKNLVRSANFTEPFISAKAEPQFPPGASRKYGQRKSINYKLIPIRLNRFSTNKAREKI